MKFERHRSNHSERTSNPNKDQQTIRLAAFHAADTENNNHLTLHEFVAALKALNFEYSNDEFLTIFNSVDLNENGVIDIDEFLLMFENVKFEEE